MERHPISQLSDALSAVFPLADSFVIYCNKKVYDYLSTDFVRFNRINVDQSAEQVLISGQTDAINNDNLAFMLLKGYDIEVTLKQGRKRLLVVNGGAQDFQVSHGLLARIEEKEEALSNYPNSDAEFIDPAAEIDLSYLFNKQSRWTLETLAVRNKRRAYLSLSVILSPFILFLLILSFAFYMEGVYYMVPLIISLALLFPFFLFIILYRGVLKKAHLSPTYLELTSKYGLARLRNELSHCYENFSYTITKTLLIPRFTSKILELNKIAYCDVFLSSSGNSSSYYLYLIYNQQIVTFSLLSKSQGMTLVEALSKYIVTGDYKALNKRYKIRHRLSDEFLSYLTSEQKKRFPRS